MSYKFVCLGLLALVGLAGCTSPSSASHNGSAATAADTKVAGAHAPTSQDIVNFLDAHCSGAQGSIILVPSAWMSIGSGSSGSQRYQLDLSGSEDWTPDYIVAVDVAGSSSDVTVTIPPEFSQNTNYELGAWGCDFAVPSSGGSDSSSTGGGAPTSNVQLMPDLSGISGDTVQQEVWSAGYQFHVVRTYTTFNPPSACMAGVSGIGMVVDQSVAAGTQFEDSQSYSVTVVIDCDYQF